MLVLLKWGFLWGLFMALREETEWANEQLEEAAGRQAEE